MRISLVVGAWCRFAEAASSRSWRKYWELVPVIMQALVDEGPDLIAGALASPVSRYHRHME
jgi:hypothetical protein